VGLCRRGSPHGNTKRAGWLRARRSLPLSRYEAARSRYVRRRHIFPAESVDDEGKAAVKLNELGWLFLGACTSAASAAVIVYAVLRALHG